VTDSYISNLQRTSDWSGVRAGVVGLGIAGFAAGDALIQLGAQVVLIDANAGESQVERATILEILGAQLQLGNDTHLPENLNLLVVSPGLSPNAPIIQAALAAGIPVWGELELAWRLRDLNKPAPWLVITGTNGKTTTTLMLESILQTAGLRAVAAGNIGRSLVEVMMDPEGWDVLAIEVGAPQLPFVYSMSPLASVCLNLAPDHIDLFGSFEAYRDAKARIYENTQVAAIFNAADQETIRMVQDADVVEGCRAIGFSNAIPDVSMVGVVEDMLVDRAFLDDRRNNALEIMLTKELAIPAAHNVENALAAIALARAYGLSPREIRDGLRAWVPAKHRIATVATINEVTYIDDSKATNTHAAATSLNAYENVIWIAGGLAKGQDFNELVINTAHRMRAVVLLGADQDVIAAALSEHAPQVPLIHVRDISENAIHEVVAQATRLAHPGDTVLLAPGCASWDMFRDYSHRGDAFATAVRELQS
jgi:UDP-N-acetylmuramoylalanine--D-glutamate ligase